MLNIRNRHFENVSKSEIAGYNAAKQRVRYLSFGKPPPGDNGGNNAVNTHLVLQIVKKVMDVTENCGDGG